MGHLVIRKPGEDKHKKIRSFKYLQTILYLSIALNIVGILAVVHLTTLLYRLKG